MKNRNNYTRKKINKQNKNLFDISNSNIFLHSRSDNSFFTNFSTLDKSKNDFFDFNINNYQLIKKNDINQINYLNKMNNNMNKDTNKDNSFNIFIQSLDKKFNNENDKNNKIDVNKTNLLLKILLKNTEETFNDKYSDLYYNPYPLPCKQLLPPNFEESLSEKIIKENILIDASIENLLDLIELCNKYPLADNIEYNINMKSLHDIKPSLIELNNMIGMQSIKENIVDQILYFIQDLHNISEHNSDYMHAVIYGPPGTGKTEVAKIMGKIFSNLGILKNNVFKKVTRDDLVAGYLGQTAMKTKDVIKSCIGGVLFIDEAYALGNSEKRDSFAKESIDTICEALSDHKKDLMCIIAGYENELKNCFFSFNEGLESRFTWRFKIDEYSSQELQQIFEKKVTDSGWKIKGQFNNSWFEKNKNCFQFFGRDMETLFSKVKIAHSRRVFCLPKEDKTYIIQKDLEKGFEIYMKNESIKNRVNKLEFNQSLHNSLYC